MYAETFLTDFSFSNDEIADICLAIGNHEAFKPTVSCRSHLGRILSDCLFDADKFRWGPDN
ncbi:MAG: hypothetical protein P8Y36_01810, partial [Alphaproteobacteria bacterium]